MYTMRAMESISVRHGDAGNTVASPTPKNWRLFGQKNSTFGQIEKLDSRLSNLESFRYIPVA